MARFEKSTTRQVLVDYAASSLAPYTLLDCLCSEDSNNEGMSLIYETLNKAIKETKNSGLSGLGTNQSLLVWDNSEEGDSVSKFKLLSLNSSGSGTSDGTLPAESIFGGDGGIYTRVKYADSLYYNTDTVSGVYIPYLIINNKVQTTEYLNVPDATGGNKALIYNGSEITWGAAGAVMTNITNNTSTPYFLVATADADRTAPSELFYNRSVYVSSGNLYHASDETLKHFTAPLDINLDNLATIKKGYFYWKEDPEKIVNIGVTAQSVEALYPELVTSCMGYKAVDYEKLSVVALAAIDKLHERVTDLEKQIEQLKSSKN